jgi:hypothetical protein
MIELENRQQAVNFMTHLSNEGSSCCSACHAAGPVIKIFYPRTDYTNDGRLITKYGEYWLCPSCRKKLAHALEWPDNRPKHETKGEQTNEH